MREVDRIQMGSGRRRSGAWSSVVTTMVGVALVALHPTAGIAQCRPPASSHEARLLAFYSTPIAFSTATAPVALPAWGVRLDVEGATVPVPSASLRRTSLCYQSTAQSTRLAPVFGRARLTIGLPAGLSFEGSYLPPLTVAGATPALASLAVTRSQGLPWSDGPARLALRVHGTIGTVRGAITCARGALQTIDPSAPCFGTRPSRDTFRPDMLGGEAILVIPLSHERVTLFGGGGATWLRPQFRVGFIDGGGGADHTQILATLTRASILAGATAHVTRAIDLTMQVYSVPVDATTWRLGAGYRLR